MNSPEVEITGNVAEAGFVKTWQALEVPGNPHWDGTVLRWDPSENAGSYRLSISVKDLDHGTTTGIETRENYYDCLPTIKRLVSGMGQVDQTKLSVSVTVQAVTGDKNTYVNSKKSEECILNWGKLSTLVKASNRSQEAQKPSPLSGVSRPLRQPGIRSSTAQTVNSPPA